MRHIVSAPNQLILGTQASIQGKYPALRTSYFVLNTRYVIACVLLLAAWLGLARPTQAQHPQAGTPPTKSDNPQTGCEPGWQVVTSSSVGDSSNLNDVAVVSADDAWTVGTYFGGTAQRTLIMRWNGSGWNVVPSPNIGTGSNYLQSVDALSANDVWAAGFYVNGATKQTLVEHWNGSVWSVALSANVASTDNFLYDVEAVTATNAWAVGYYYSGAVERTLILHWNGSTWTVVSSPNVGAGTNGLHGITVVSANDIWAVGSYLSGTTSRTLAMHWNGTNWNLDTSANQGAGANYLYDVKAVATDDIWAVGAYRNAGVYRTLILHRDGVNWSVVQSPNVGSNANSLLGVAAVSADDIWAVGYYDITSSTERTLVEHWNGSAWEVVTSDNLNVTENRLYRVAVVSQDELWAAGFSKDESFQTLVEHYTCSACTIAFTDVPQGSPFYDYVRCMACQGIIGGYTSGCETGNPCFRPNNNVTRGQLSKIVANAAGFNEPAGAQQYEDVPSGSAFYDYVWRLSNRGYINGYQCGGGVPPGSEPCVPPNNLPYFRPNGNATRGQISKIVSNAANFQDPPGSQLFEDVAPGSTFYDFVQRLANHAAMSGYPCGGAGEPCIPPGNRPYFRPNANATRGQTSKIVSVAFFPGCALDNRRP